MRSFSTRLFVVAVISASSAGLAAPVSIRLTTDALGIGAGTTWKGDSASQAGKIFNSPMVGMGSILQIQTNGLAGPGTAMFPSLVKVTARTHLDITTFPVGYPVPNDYHAAALYVTKNGDNFNPHIGADEGLGVQAFTIYSSGPNLGKKQPDGAGYKVEGSTEISGGTDPGPFDPSSPNGAPHVDESVDFSFDPNAIVMAKSITVSLANFSSDEKVWVDIMTQNGMLNFPVISTGVGSPLIMKNNDTYWLDFSLLAGLAMGDNCKWFSIRAIENDPGNARGTAEHFLVSGFFGDYVPIPTPSAFAVMALGMGIAARRRRA